MTDLPPRVYVRTVLFLKKNIPHKTFTEMTGVLEHSSHDSCSFVPTELV